MSHAPLDLHTAEGMLSFVDGCEDRETWVSVGMALKSEFGDAAFTAWDAWSQNAANYSSGACRASWKGFKSRAGGYTIGTLIKLAKDGGYKFDRNDAPAVDRAELERRRAERAARAAAEAAQRATHMQGAQTQALAQWRAALRTGESPYAKRKGIPAPESVRFTPDGDLLVPMIRYDLPPGDALKGLQTIRADGAKKFTFGMDKPGCACRLGPALATLGEPIFVCEGWATGMTLRMALQNRFPVFVAFDAGNLPLVVYLIYQLWPASPMVICADDDWATKVKGLPYNTGRIEAQIAMDGVMEGKGGATYVVRSFPVFKKETARGPKDTDFNDLARLQGLADVTSQMELCLEALQYLKNNG